MKNLLKATAAAAVFTAMAGAAHAADVKACWVYVGPVGDFGWTYQHDQGRQAVVAEFGDKVETAFLESVPEGPDAERAIERFARDGCDIVFTTSFGYMNPTVKVAKKYPDVKFEHATGYKSADNLATYNSKFHEGRYIIGQIAGKMSKTGVAGYITSFPIPEVISGINAFMLGAQTVNPDFKVKVVWANTWFDPAKEADAAKALADQGVDIMVQHTDSTAPLQVAQERGIHGFGQASDMIAFAPKSQYTAIIDEWGPYYIERIKEVMEGTWETKQTWSGLAEGHVVMAPYTNLPDDVVAMAKETEAKISGGWEPFTGPIFNQEGEKVVEDGVTLEDGAILGMDWYVQGVDDKLSK
ncbi:BMP family ABC transporter substrate-binding protein [Roseibium limicola]|uniref:BMP family ABC transporter substrate-binding protein n=1 Tax=Roseibium limicola TaxID=2816037 RepID=A0A939EL50_9HYPH|nr:BMP family ABC transporter substrate-binding protein [Roseibium limicola]MBO0344442.1 BMP family ABC transporter substrate-binding protein [Roseibium limicola]